MAKLKVGVLGGAGDAGEGHIRGYQATGRADVVAVWDVNEDKGRQRCLEAEIPTFCPAMEELLERDDVDIVSVCTPDHLHACHGVAALRAGKHVLCEKPMSTTREDAARMVDAVRETGRVFLAGHNYHFTPAHRAMAEACWAGEIGQVWLAEGDYISNLHYIYGPEGRTPWRSDEDNPQDILLGGGCHPLGLMRWAMRAEVVEVHAYSNHLSEPLLPIDDAYTMTMRWDNGAMGKLIAASGCRGYVPHGGNLALWGTEGTLWGSRLFKHDEASHGTILVRDFGEEAKAHPPRVSDTAQVHYWAEQCDHMLDCVEGKAEPMSTVLDGARVIAALTAGIESARTGQAIQVDNDF